MNNAKDLFEKWYAKPLNFLSTLERLGGDGTFIAFATSLFLYERYAKTLIKKSGKKANNQEFCKQFMYDFNTDETTSKTFWDVMRHGILHSAMPKKNGMVLIYLIGLLAINLLNLLK